MIGNILAGTTGIPTPPVIPDTKFLIAGGNSTTYKKTFMYDISADTYTAKADMSSDHAEWPGGGYYSGSAYIFGGGYTGSFNANEAYNVSSNTWSSKTSMSAGRLDLSYVTYDNKIWAIGGKASGSNATLKTLYYYDPVANSWTQKADMPDIKAQGVSGVIGGKIYTACGYKNTASPNVNYVVKATYEYDPVANTWATKANSTYAHTVVCSGGSANGTSLFVFGSGEVDPPNNEAEKYTPSSNTWSNITDSTNTLASSYSPLLYNANGNIYVGSGSAASGATQVYNISGNSWTGKSGTPSVGMSRTAIVSIP